MSPGPPASDRARRGSLRRRVVLTFAALAVGPFLVLLAILFTVARHDVGDLQGRSLVQDAQLLAEQVQTQLELAESAAAGLASLPEVRSYLAGSTPFPAETLGDAKRFLPGLRELELLRSDEPETASERAAPGALSWGTEQGLEFRLGVTDLGGRRVGWLRASFDLERLHRLLEWFRKGEHGRAVLYGAGGERLAGQESVPLPPRDVAPGTWATFSPSGGGAQQFVGVAAVAARRGASAPDWRVAVLQPAAELYRPFHVVARQLAVLIGVFAVLVIALAWRMADQFLHPILQIRHGAEIISRINLGHRIQVDTGDELEGLAAEFNHMAANLAGAYSELEERVQETTRSLQEERNRLATVLRTMVEGVVVANEAAEAILMNPRARLVLGSGPSSGVGAPLGRILPADRLEFHLRRLRRSWEVGREAVEEVVFPLPSGTVLKGMISVVPGNVGQRAGYLLVFRDISATAEEDAKIETAVRELPEVLRGPIASVRSLAETVQRHPEMPDGKKAAFLAAIREETGRLIERLAVLEEAAAAGSANSRWTQVPSDPREMVEEAVASVPGVYARVEIPDAGAPQVLVEPFSWVAALACVLRWIAGSSSGWVPVMASLRVEEDDAVVTSFRVEGAFDGDPTLLESLEVAPSGEAPLPLGEVVRRNRGELWTRDADEGFEVRLALVRASVSRLGPRRGGLADDQPEFYDFDLFLPRPTQEAGNLLQTDLAALEFVVFDTETTGLRPSQGDEVVSLSAIRVRRGKIQAAETFHTLINPGRPIPAESSRFHGIDDAQVREAPPLGEVLPRFYEYVGDAVLVAHNAAFDKKFLDLAADAGGLPHLDNPILDTLFLSYGIHKDFEGHNLDAIARRLGIEIEGRHTSLGDARATAEILLRLISLLSSRGVTTLADAKAFCDRMLLLRWQSSRF